jgi:hypothetical protein
MCRVQEAARVVLNQKTEVSLIAPNDPSGCSNLKQGAFCLSVVNLHVPIRKHSTEKDRDASFHHTARSVPAEDLTS